MNDANRRLVGQRHARGRRAEDVAAAHLDALGWSIEGRNVRVGRLEVDILARDGDCVVVVEVRTRSAGSWFGGLSSVGLEKRKRLRRAGERLWRQRYARDATVQRMRFDIVAVRLGPGTDAPPGEASDQVEHVRAAF